MKKKSVQPTNINADFICQSLEALTNFSQIVLVSLATHSTRQKETTIRNIIARGLTCVHSIHRLWKERSFQDCWTLNRTLVDRLFHLHHLEETDSFDKFEKWSFIRQFEDKNRLISDPDMKEKTEGIRFTDEEKERYRQLKEEDISWQRPDPKKTAKQLDLPFFYKYGYDYASTHVHPMATDGEEDFSNWTGAATPRQDDVVLNNSLLAYTLILQNGLNACELEWRALVYDFVDGYRKGLVDGSQNFRLTLEKIKALFSSTDLCRYTNE